MVGLRFLAVDPLINRLAPSVTAAYLQIVQQASATQGEATSIASTSSAQKTQTASWSLTRTAIPTLSATPTPTIIPTPAATPIIIQAKFIGSDKKLYPIYGGGQRKNVIPIPEGTILEVIGRVKNTEKGWYKVKMGSQEGWVRTDMVERLKNLPNEYDLSHLMKWTGEYVPIMEEMFAGDNIWVSKVISKEKPLAQEFHTLTLRAISPNEDEAAQSNKIPSNISAFKLYTSFKRSDSNANNSFVGIRFRAKEGRFYSVRIYNDCHIEVFISPSETNPFQPPRRVEPGENICSDSGEDFLYVALDKDNSLQVQINDSKEERFPILPDPNNVFRDGVIVLEAHNTIADFSFLVITIPR
ncbi:hypothetical protein HY990_02000 [Candidatus Micrarchaeota archaeon]|nr:hypothetical protein [Candidatus Micrarchaeota archaeon]